MYESPGIKVYCVNILSLGGRERTIVEAVVVTAGLVLVGH